jgi:23S rRNA pseudouridine955/2504/2580 synthase
LVHRLDRDTSGVLVVARTPGVAARLAAAFRGRSVEKIYWAVVVGRPVPVSGRIENELVRVDGFRGERAAIAGPYDDDKTAHAITDYRTRDHAGRKLAWLELKPLTGRTHQLRVHCASIGAPIVGDAPYGIEREGRNIALVDGFPAQLHLHARRIVLPHPGGGTLAVEAPLPPHMQATFRDLGFDAPPVAGVERRR